MKRHTVVSPESRPSAFFLFHRSEAIFSTDLIFIIFIYQLTSSANSVDPDETVPLKPFNPSLDCLQSSCPIVLKTFQLWLTQDRTLHIIGNSSVNSVYHGLQSLASTKWNMRLKKGPWWLSPILLKYVAKTLCLANMQGRGKSDWIFSQIPLFFFFFFLFYMQSM